MLVLSDEPGFTKTLPVQQEHQPPAGGTALHLQREYVYYMHI
jgi:hypothetical protein